MHVCLAHTTQSRHQKEADEMWQEKDEELAKGGWTSYANEMRPALEGSGSLSLVPEKTSQAKPENDLRGESGARQRYCEKNSGIKRLPVSCYPSRRIPGQCLYSGRLPVERIHRCKATQIL